MGTALVAQCVNWLFFGWVFYWVWGSGWLFFGGWGVGAPFGVRGR